MGESHLIKEVMWFCHSKEASSIIRYISDYEGKNIVLHKNGGPTDVLEQKEDRGKVRTNASK